MNWITVQDRFTFVVTFVVTLQIDEEQNLVSELRKIEARKKERDKKAQDLQKLITAADSQGDPRKLERKIPRKKLQQARPRIDTTVSHFSYSNYLLLL